MNTILELITTAGQFLVGLWPAMFVLLLVGIFRRRDGFGTMMRTSVKALVIAWAFFGLLRAVFYYIDLATFQLIPEPQNTRYFLYVGLALLPIALAITIEEYRKRSVAKTIEDMQMLTSTEFEKLVASVYRDQGHKVDIVGARGDHGIDLIVHTKEGETWLVQCKKYRGKVGEPVVRDFYGVLRASQAQAGAIVTTGMITPQARLWAEGKPIFLYDGRAFLKIMQSTRLRKTLPSTIVRNEDEPVKPVKVIKPSLEPEPYIAAYSHAAAPAPVYEADLPDKRPFMDISGAPDCPACGTPMVLKTSNRFPFKAKSLYICSNAPECKETFPVE